MTMLALVLAALSWALIVVGLSGGYKSTGGAVYTASGVALTITLGGHSAIRALASRLGRWPRRLLLLATVMAVAGVGVALEMLLLA